MENRKMNTPDSIKCGRSVIKLNNGDYVMDNGKCYQLIFNSNFGKCFPGTPPRVSKKEFEKFKKNKKVVQVKRDQSHGFLTPVTLFIYENPQPKGSE